MAKFGPKNAAGLKAIGDRLIVEVEVLDEVTKGGVLIPKTVKDRYDAAKLEAVVIDVGETATMQLDVFPEVGDRILISKYAGTEHKDPELAKYRIIRADDVLAVFQ